MTGRQDRPILFCIGLYLGPLSTLRQIISNIRSRWEESEFLPVPYHHEAKVSLAQQRIVCVLPTTGRLEGYGSEDAIPRTMQR